MSCRYTRSRGCLLGQTQDWVDCLPTEAGVDVHRKWHKDPTLTHVGVLGSLRALHGDEHLLSVADNEGVGHRDVYRVVDAAGREGQVEAPLVQGAMSLIEVGMSLIALPDPNVARWTTLRMICLAMTDRSGNRTLSRNAFI